MNTRKNKVYLFLLIVGISGIALFFPWNFKDGSTCIADYYIDQNEILKPNDIHYEMRMHMYVFPFGFLWWLSIFIIVFIIYLLWRSKTILKNKQIERWDANHEH